MFIDIIEKACKDTIKDKVTRVYDFSDVSGTENSKIYVFYANDNTAIVSLLVDDSVGGMSVSYTLSNRFEILSDKDGDPFVRFCSITDMASYVYGYKEFYKINIQDANIQKEDNTSEEKVHYLKGIKEAKGLILDAINSKAKRIQFKLKCNVPDERISDPYIRLCEFDRTVIFGEHSYVYRSINEKLLTDKRYVDMLNDDNINDCQNDLLFYISEEGKFSDDDMYNCIKDTAKHLNYVFGNICVICTIS